MGAYTKIRFFETDANLLYQDEIHGSLMNRLLKFTASENMLISTRVTEGVTEKVTVRVTVKVTEKEQAVLDPLIEDPAYTYSALSDKLGISRKTVSLRIQSLKSIGIIRRIGSDTKGYRDTNNDLPK